MASRTRQIIKVGHTAIYDLSEIMSATIEKSNVIDNNDKKWAIIIRFKNSLSIIREVMDNQELAEAMQKELTNAIQRERG